MNSDCVLRAASCCGDCGAPRRGDAIALNAAYFSAYGDSVCRAAAECILCLVAPPPDNTLLATCDAGECRVVDLQEHPVTECETAGDCVLRAPECCECGGSTAPAELIAINGAQRRAYSDLVCDPAAICLGCVPTYPSVPVDCDAGRCVVVK